MSAVIDKPSLLSRLESATEDEGYLIKRVVRHAWTQGWIDRETHDTALHWAAVGAFLSAAVSLVPEGWYWEIKQHSDGAYVEIADSSLRMNKFKGSQRPAALALCIAIIKANEAEKAA